jgi:hypothetical protein
MTSDYKKYSLEKLQDWVHDAMNSDASQHEIYSAIREAVREEYYYHKDCISRASGLLELLSGHRPVKSDDSKKWDAWEENYYPEEYKADKVKKWVLPVEEVRDEDTDEDIYCVSFPDDLLEAANLKEGDQVEWVDQGDGSYLIKKVPMTYDEMIAAGWTMTADGFWIKE